MDRPVRIVVAGPVDDRLPGALRQLPLRPDVQVSASLLADSEAVLRFQPDVLLLGLDRPPAGDPGEEVGALRLLQRLWPGLATVLVVPPEAETALAPLAARLRSQLLVFPDSPAMVAAVLEQALLYSDRPRADVFVDLARGVADEINNPLLFVSGHLQLLLASFDAAAERQRRDQIAAAMAGLERVQAAVDRLRQLSAAVAGPRRRETIDLQAVLDAALAPAARPGAPAMGAARDDAGHAVPGDPDQVAPAVAALVQFAAALGDAGAEVDLRLQGTTFVLQARGPMLAGWALPQTFEPYYPTRALRGQGQGLGLCLLQAVVLGHRGQATVRRLADGSLRFQFAFPGAVPRPA